MNTLNASKSPFFNGTVNDLIYSANVLISVAYRLQKEYNDNKKEIQEPK